MKAGKRGLPAAILCLVVLTFAGCGGEKKESEPASGTVEEQQEPGVDDGQKEKDANGEGAEKGTPAAEGETTVLPDGTKMTVVEGENGGSMEIVTPDGETSVVPLTEMQGYLPNMQPDEMEIIELPENLEAATLDSSDAAELIEIGDSEAAGVLSDGTVLVTLAQSGSPTVFENGAGNAAVLPVQTAADLEGESLDFSGGGDVEDSGVYVVKEYHLEDFQKNTNEFSAASYYANLERYETVRFELFGGRVEDVAFRYHTDFKQGEQVLFSDLLPEDLPTKKGCVFDGFYILEDWGMRMLDPRDVLTESETVYAKWITEEESQAKLREAFANLPYQVGPDSQVVY